MDKLTIDCFGHTNAVDGDSHSTADGWRGRIKSFVFEVICLEFEVRESGTDCELATPKITFSSAGNYINLPENITADIINQTAKVRVGYIEVFGVFQYKGCSNLNDLPPSIRNGSVNSDPGQCYSYCKKTYFAIFKNRCYCLPDLDETKEKKEKVCTQKCPTTGYFLCGSEYETNYVYASVYKYAETLYNVEQGTHHCYGYDNESGSFKWLECGKKKAGICQDSANYYPYNNTTRNWKDYTVKCLKDGKLPSDDDISKFTANVQNVAGEQWIGKIRSLIITSTQAAPDSELDFHGFIKWNGDENKFSLDFDSKESLMDNKCLCIKVSESQPRNEMISSQTKGNNGLIAVYVVIPLCVFTGVVVVVVLSIKRKKYRRRTRCNNKSKSTIQQQNTQNVTYDEHFSPDTQVQAHYFILEPQGDTGSCPNSKPCKTEFPTTPVYEEEYDSTTMPIGALNHTQTGGNLYNEFEKVAGIYDSASDPIEQNETDFSVNDDTYEHVETKISA